MEISLLIEALNALNEHKPIECTGDLTQLIESNLHNICKKYNQQFANIPDLIPKLTNIFNFKDESLLMRYIALNYYYLFEIINRINECEMNVELSAKDNAFIRNIFKNLIGISINANLLTNMPSYCKIKSESFFNESDLITKQYNRLAISTYGIFLCIQSPLKETILCDHFQSFLNALYQLIYCPIKKPSVGTEKGFHMSVEMYEKLLKEREIFKTCLEYIATNINTHVYAKETMILLDTKCVWFKKAAAFNLTKILKSHKGLEIIATALFEYSTDYDPNDTAKMWKPLDVLVKLIMSLRKTVDFKTNICKQVTDLLQLKARNGDHIKPFELIFITTIERLHKEDPELCYEVFLCILLNPLINLTNTNYLYDDDNLTDVITQNIRLLYSLFVNYNLPLTILTPVINVIFYFHTNIPNNNFITLNEQLKELLLRYLNCADTLTRHKSYDAFLFDIYSSEIRPLINHIDIIKLDDAIKMKLVRRNTNCNLNKSSFDLMKLLEQSATGELLVSFFIYLLQCLNLKDKYFKITNEAGTKNEFKIDKSVERNLLVYTLLSALSENKIIQDDLNHNPKDIIDYILNVLNNTIACNIHVLKNCESSEFQTSFTIIMILQALVVNCAPDNVIQYKQLLEPLKIILTQCIDDELRTLVGSIVQMLEKDRINQRGTEIKVSELEKAIEDVCDPLLPIRGHGLMSLAKLVENKEIGVMERKMYILNIFQQNLKNDDSYIYLNAINGLAAMGNILPELVLIALTDEFSDDTKRDLEDGSELRMKLGEVLVRVTRQLGDNAPKYKSLLLNTFLVGSKDDDHLIRASSLSNLGEVCKVLGYKLGSIVKEVLACVHGVINTDKAVEARRAAVTVIRQLFDGLESETISFLKDDILEIYRSLKNIYVSDSDDVMRLQAQLALEELGEIVKQFLLVNKEVTFQRKTSISN